MRTGHYDGWAVMNRLYEDWALERLGCEDWALERLGCMRNGLYEDRAL
jgi:hypothetical protein